MDKPKQVPSTARLIVTSIAGGVLGAALASLILPPHALWSPDVWTRVGLFAVVFAVIQYGSARFEAAHGKGFQCSPEMALSVRRMTRTCYVAGGVLLVGIAAAFLCPGGFSPALLFGAFALVCLLLAAGVWRMYRGEPQSERHASDRVFIGSLLLMGLFWLLVTTLSTVAPDGDISGESHLLARILAYTAVGLGALGLITFLLSWVWLARQTEKLPPS